MMRIRSVAAVTVLAVLAVGCKKQEAAPAAAEGAAAPAAAAAAPAAAQGLKVSKTVSVAATAAAAWDKVKDFDKLNTWHPAIAKAEIVEGKNNEVGAVRLLTLGDGATIKEKLTAYDDAAHSYSYVILEGPLPIANYSATISVATDGEAAATVTWAGEFKAAEGKDDKTATETVEGIYTAGLENLKKLLETK